MESDSGTGRSLSDVLGLKPTRASRYTWSEGDVTLAAAPDKDTAEPDEKEAEEEAEPKEGYHDDA